MTFKSSTKYKFDYLLNLFKNDYDDCISFCKEMLKIKSIKSNIDELYFWECLIIDFEINKELIKTNNHASIHYRPDRRLS